MGYNMENNKYLDIISFIKKYHGEKYKDPQKCRTIDERQYMLVGAEKGKKARNLFTELADIIQKEYSLSYDRVTQWQNSGTFVSYFWCQLKKPEHKDSQISISLFAESADEKYRFRVSVEIANSKATELDKGRYRRLLDIPKDDEFVYIKGGNNESDFEVLEESSHIKVKEENYKKIQVSYILNEQNIGSEENTIKKLKDATDTLLKKYYDYLFMDNTISKNNKTIYEERIVVSNMNIKSISVIDSLKIIKEYISSKGFTYSSGLIENFFLSLKSKPFVILAGTSGTGKTRLVKLFAEAIGAVYHLIPVRPDWSDGSDLFGHTDLNGNFKAGPVCEAFDAAIKDPEKPVILCLDEMNLARVEYYFSDFLSVLETREWEEDRQRIVTPVAIMQYEKGIPDNLYIVGTVNMDETTFPFSKKVLDRANTIEFNDVNLIPDFDAVGDDIEPLQLKNDFLRAEYLVMSRDCVDEREYIEDICLELNELNEKMKDANTHVGYRVRDEIVFYMLNNKKAGNLLPRNEAMDNEIMQKILPRIQGSAESIKKMLTELFYFCMGDKSGLDSESGQTGEKMKSLAKSAKYPKSAEKIRYMMSRYEDDGFTSYWL